MKVVCPYCDSYIEADENRNCPNCGGSVAAEVKEAEDRFQQEEAQRKEAEAEMQKKQQEEEQDRRILEVLLAAVTGAVSTRGGRSLIRSVVNMLFRGKKGGWF